MSRKPKQKQPKPGHGKATGRAQPALAGRGQPAAGSNAPPGRPSSGSGARRPGPAASPPLPGPAVTLQLLLDSDWHVGSGAGRQGDVDRLVQRDPDGFPFVPAKTLIGVWRDACERVALGLDNGVPGAWSGYVELLFGDQPGLAGHPRTELPPRPALLQVRPARLPEVLRQALRARPLVAEALTFVKPRVKIDGQTGQAEDEHLCFDELVRGGTPLQAAARLDLPAEWSAEQQAAAWALLLCGARFAERLGGKRRRGAGRCSLQVDGIGDAAARAWIDWVEQVGEVALPTATAAVATGRAEGLFDLAATPTPAAGGTAPWRRLRLRLRCKTPLVVPWRTVGNVVESLDHLPGTLLLGPLSRALQRATGLDLRPHIGAGELQVLAATPEVKKGCRGLPVPLALFYGKLAGGLQRGRGVVNRLVEPATAGGKDQLKGHRKGWVADDAAAAAQAGEAGEKKDQPEGRRQGRVADDAAAAAAATQVGAVGGGAALPAYATSKLAIFTHNSVEDERQRPTEETGGVYSFQALPAGTELIAELRLTRALEQSLAAARPGWWSALPSELRLGRAKKDDFGQVALEPIDDRPQDLPGHDGTEAGQQLYVWLLSDLLLRDDRLRPTVSAARLAEALCEAHGGGLSLKLREQPGLLSRITGQRRRDSWHEGWGLPRPTLAGLQGGSCFVFKVTAGALDPVRLAAIEASGLGERRAEGYGQVRLQAQWLRQPLAGMVAERHAQQQKQDERGQGQGGEAGGAAFNGLSRNDTAQDIYEYARTLEQVALEAAIRQASLRLAATADGRRSALGLEGNQPPASQLGALRERIARLPKLDPKKADGHQRAIAPVLDWLEHLKTVDSRRDKWPPEALARVTALLTKQEQVWKLLQLDEEELRRRKITKVKLDLLKALLWSEAVRALVDDCLRAHKRQRELVDGQVARWAAGDAAAPLQEA